MPARSLRPTLASGRGESVAAASLAFGRDESNSPQRRGLKQFRRRKKQSKNFDVDGPDPVAVSSGIIVSGGCLNKPWAIASDAGGVAHVRLSSNNYSLAVFLFGKVNKQGGRALLAEGSRGAKFIRRIWRARNNAQDEGFKEFVPAVWFPSPAIWEGQKSMPGKKKTRLPVAMEVARVPVGC